MSMFRSSRQPDQLPAPAPAPHPYETPPEFIAARQAAETALAKRPEIDGYLKRVRADLALAEQQLERAQDAKAATMRGAADARRKGDDAFNTYLAAVRAASAAVADAEANVSAFQAVLAEHEAEASAADDEIAHQAKEFREALHQLTRSCQPVLEARLREAIVPLVQVLMEAAAFTRFAGAAYTGFIDEVVIPTAWGNGRLVWVGRYTAGDESKRFLEACDGDPSVAGLVDELRPIATLARTLNYHKRYDPKNPTPAPVPTAAESVAALKATVDAIPVWKPPPTPEHLKFKNGSYAVREPGTPVPERE